MAFASISVPRWISFSTPSSQGSAPLEQHIGLRHLCSTVDGTQTCRPYPDASSCASADGAGACSLWSMVGFLASTAAVMCLAALMALLIVTGAGKYQRQRHWSIACAVLLVAALIQFAVMSMVVSFPATCSHSSPPSPSFAFLCHRANKIQAYHFDHDQLFLVPGWHLGTSWYLCTTSTSLSVLSAVGLAISAYILPPEGGYQFLTEPWSP